MCTHSTSWDNFDRGHNFDLEVTFHNICKQRPVMTSQQCSKYN